MKVNKFKLPSIDRYGRFFVGVAWEKDCPQFMRVLANASQRNTNVGTEIARLAKLGLEREDQS